MGKKQNILWPRTWVCRVIAYSLAENINRASFVKKAKRGDLVRPLQITPQQSEDKRSTDYDVKSSKCTFLSARHQY